ncbi:heterokaryon incompatibility, partial [Patellaria atrata CBS 101060]
CELKISRSSAQPPYIVLSYTWGDPNVTENKYLDSKELHVTTKLRLVLSHLRQDEGDLLLWIDALCINQKDVREKTSQVAMMREIYSEATKVVG